MKIDERRTNRSLGILRPFSAALGLGAALVWCGPVRGEETLAPARASLTAADTAGAAGVGTRRALIVCGHPGDAEHFQAFSEVATRLREGLVKTAGIPSGEVKLYFGVDPERDDKALIPEGAVGPATREALTAAVETLRQELRPEDALWVVVLGHGHYDGRRSWLNLPGPDFHQDEVGKLFRGLACREQVFVVATPASGFYVKPLSAPGRVVISATEADLEVNETLFAAALAEELIRLGEPAMPKAGSAAPPAAEAGAPPATPPAAEAGQEAVMPPPSPDADGDGVLTLFDLYIATTRGVAQKYIAESLLITEHALIDDNGDGRATEVQRDYLTEAEGGRKRASFVPSHPAGQDGSAAAQIRLVVP